MQLSSSYLQPRKGPLRDARWQRESAPVRFGPRLRNGGEDGLNNPYCLCRCVSRSGDTRGSHGEPRVRYPGQRRTRHADPSFHLSRRFGRGRPRWRPRDAPVPPLLKAVPLGHSLHRLDASSGAISAHTHHRVKKEALWKLLHIWSRERERERSMEAVAGKCIRGFVRDGSKLAPSAAYSASSHLRWSTIWAPFPAKKLGSGHAVLFRGQRSSSSSLVAASPEDLPVGKQIQFKFILKSFSGEVKWQPGPDRCLQAWETSNTIVVSEDWENAESQKIAEEEPSLLILVQETRSSESKIGSNVGAVMDLTQIGEAQDKLIGVTDITLESRNHDKNLASYEGLLLVPGLAPLPALGSASGSPQGTLPAKAAVDASHESNEAAAEHYYSSAQVNV
ncbi:hypothetical protein GW17_00017675 [Ensete ventricosum]|nr:hypothetical protein GW17_00017675 [Ensete ventricosum]